MNFVFLRIYSPFPHTRFAFLHSHYHFLITTRRLPSILPFAIRNGRSLERQMTKHGSQYSIITFIQNNYENKMFMSFTYCVPSIPLNHSVRYIPVFGVPSRACRIRMNEVSGRVALVMACNSCSFTHYRIIILYVLFEAFSILFCTPLF